MRISSEAEYLVKADGGARINFNYLSFRLLDTTDEYGDTHHFLILFGDKKENDEYFLVSAAEAFELLARWNLQYTETPEWVQESFGPCMKDMLEELFFEN